MKSYVQRLAHVWLSNKVLKIRYLTGVKSISGFTMKVALKFKFNIIMYSC